MTEDMGIPGIDWITGYPLTARGWAGGSYVLVNDYVRDDPADGFVPVDDSQPANPTPATVKVNSEAPVPVGDTIVIDGVTYIRTP